MANVNFNVPFNPQEGITQQILTAIQLANEHHVQNQQLALQQQAQPSEIALREAQTGQSGAQTQQIQQTTAANLPAAQAAGENARTQYQQLQTQIDQENNPLVKAHLQAQSRGLNAEASFQEGKTALMNNPTDYSAAVDNIVDPKKYAELNKRTKAQMDALKPQFALQPELPARILGEAGSEIGTIERETDPSIIASRVSQAVQTQKGLYGGGQVSDVAPHLVPAATADATKAGTDYATFSGQMKNLKTQLAAAKTGDEVASAFAPAAVALGSNSFYGTHRFSPTELQVLDNLGSVPRQIDAWFAKHATGTLTPDSLKEFQSLVGRLEDAKSSAYKDTLKVVNKNYGSKFEPLDFGESSPETPQGGSEIHYKVVNGELVPQ